MSYIPSRKGLECRPHRLSVSNYEQLAEFVHTVL